MEPLVFNGYQETIESFEFRQEASIQIPKNVRESAYAFQLDIEILSTNGNDYLNRKSIPAHSFYGYVVLVLRDHSEIQIPIEQPRQTVYYERRSEAYANWYSLFLFFLMSQNLLFISEFQLKPIAEELGLTAALIPSTCPDWSGFEEIRLREVYVKCRFGTRFKLESAYWSPIPVTYGECSYDGKSQQIDDDAKDDGLPKDGVQPTNNGDRANPYAGYPDPSSSLELDLWDNMGAIDDVDNRNPANEPTGLKKWAFVEGQYRDFAQGCILLYFGITFEIAIEDESLNVFTQGGYPIPDSCGSQLTIVELRGDVTGTTYATTGGDGTYITNLSVAVENPFTTYGPTPTKP